MAEPGSTPGRVRALAQGIAATWPSRGAAGAGGLAPAGFDAWSALIAKLRSWVHAEAGPGRPLPWVPVAFGSGIAFYFAADHEPVLPVVLVAAMALCVGALLARRHKLFPLIVMLAAAGAGFGTATLRTARVAHTVLARPLYSVALSGFVETRDIRERTDRFVLRVVTMESPRDQARARPALGQKGHRAGCRQLRRIEGAPDAAAGATATGIL